MNAARQALPVYLDAEQFMIPFYRGGELPTLSYIRDTVFYDVVEIDWIGRDSAASSRVAVAHRQAGPNDNLLRGPRAGDGVATLVLLRAFADRAAADDYAAELTRGARRAVNPLVVYPPPRVPLVRALGVKFRVKPLQKWGALEWQQWYEAEPARLTDEQRAKLWSLFDDLPLYGVTDVPLG